MNTYELITLILTTTYIICIITNLHIMPKNTSKIVVISSVLISPFMIFVYVKNKVQAYILMKKIIKNINNINSELKEKE